MNYVMDGYLDANQKLNVRIYKNTSVELKNLDGLFAVIAVFILDYMDMEDSYGLVAELLALSSSKHQYYQQEQRAMRLILSAS
jgi:hypothetical protein